MTDQELNRAVAEAPPITIEVMRYLDGGREPFGYWSKGHLDPKRFAEAIKDILGIDIEPRHVRHVYWRKVPAVWYDSPPPTAILEARGPGRGAFKATCVELG